MKIENADSDTAVDITPDTTDSDKVNAEVEKEQLDKVIEENLDIQMNTGILELIFESEAVQDIVKDLGAKDKVTINVENATPENAENSVRFDIYIAVNDKKQESTKFSGEYVTVTIDLAQLEATLGDPTKDVEIWYVDEDGQRLEKVEHQKDGTKVKFKTNHFSYYEVVAVDEEISTGPEVSFVNYTVNGKIKATISVGGAAVSTTEQAVGVSATLGADRTFAVESTQDVVVAYTTDGTSYTRISVSDVANTYVLHEDASGDIQIAVAFLGDVTLDGKINLKDFNKMKMVYGKKDSAFAGLELLAADVTNDETPKFNLKDYNQMKLLFMVN